MKAQDCEDRDRATRALMDLSPEALIAWSTDGRILAWNQGAEDLYGYKASAILGKSRTLLMVPDGADAKPLALQRGAAVFETVRVREDGSLVPVRIRLAPVYDVNDALIATAESSTAAEPSVASESNGLRPPNLLLSAIVESSSDAIIATSLTGVIQSWNQSAERIFGYHASEILGRSVFLLIPDERKEEEERIWERIRGGERVDHYDTVRFHKNGYGIDVSLTVSPIYDGGGTVIGASKILRDMSAIRRAERALQETQDRLKMVVDSAPLVLFVLDEKGCLQLLEGLGLALLGFKREGLLGSQFVECDKGPSAWFSEGVVYALDGHLRTRVIAVGGRTMEVRWFPINDDQDPLGRVVGVSGIALDVTEQHARQEEVIRASKWESLSLVAGGVAHDFNNVLAAIVGNLSLARVKLKSQPDILSFVEESEKAALQARGLTQQLLSFSKGGDSIRKPLDIGALVESTVAFALGGANVRAHVMMARDLWCIEADEGQLSQVVSNITLNGQQAMSEGGTMEVFGRNVVLRDHEGPLAAGDYVRLDFVDHGCGIEARDMAQVFEPFFTTKARGSGLGLTTSRRIVEEHKGLIEMESVVGQGTRVRLYLPRLVLQEIPVRDDTGGQKMKGRILFMDDEEAIRKVAHAMLGYLGYEVCVAAEGAAAIREYQRKPFDVVILDLTVRDGLGGLATLEKLRALDPEVVAVVSSGYSSDPVMADHTRFGFVAKVPKPYTPETLEATVAPLVRAQRRRLAQRSLA